MLPNYPVPVMYCWICEIPLDSRVYFDRHYATCRMIYFCSEAHKSLHEGLKSI